MRNLINCLGRRCLTLYIWLATTMRSFRNRNKLFLITRGAWIVTISIILINSLLYIYKIRVSIIINTSVSTDDITDDICSFVLNLILIGILSLIGTYIFDRIIHEYKTTGHFPYSHKIVTKRIIEIYSKKSILENYRDTNNSIDRIIKSPLEYAAETLEGNLAPYFRPNDRYIEEMYDPKVKLIIAVTAENPNLWLDPTLCFYLINCCAVSLIHNKNNIRTKRIGIQDFGSSLRYQAEVNIQQDTLNKLIKSTWDWATDLKDFDFLRFFLYNGEQKECLENTVFPSLKASHDLFKMKSYFNQIKDIDNKLEKENRLGDFRAHIDFLWDEIAKQNLATAFRKIINKRKKEHWPEFLFLFKNTDEQNIHSVTVHTFVDGSPYFVEYKESATSNNGYQIVQSLVSYIAKSVYETDPYIPAGRYLNTNKSYIEWQ